jgi:epoxyqueuosine reductase
MHPDSLTAALKEEAARLGFDLVGATPAVSPPGIDRFNEWLAGGYAGGMGYLADRAAAFRHPQHVLEGAKGILMLGVNYRTAEPVAAGLGQGRISRYAWGTDYHLLIRGRLRRLADFHGRLVPRARVRGVVDTAPLAERGFAEQAGLGWIGKNTLLINRRYGSWLFLAALLTTEELAYDEPVGHDRCGSCRACLDACPTGALTDARRLDARKCISYLTIELRDHVPPGLREALGDRLFGCDACQEACPHNGRTPSTDEEALWPEEDSNPIELSGLLLLDEEAFRRRFRHTPLWRAKRRGVLRDAALVLGTQPHRAALPTLIGALRDAEPLVRAAVGWALGRYDDPAAADALRKRLAEERDSRVREGLEAALRRPA